MELFRFIFYRLGFMRRAFRICGFVVVFLSFANTVYAGEREYAIKAVFLFNFLNYVTWPNAIQPGQSVNLCIYGKNNFGEALEYVKKKSKKYVIFVELIPMGQESELAGCHLVFIAKGQDVHDERLVQILARPGLLSVSDVDGFAENIGIIELASRGNQVKVVINTNKLEKRGFRASSRLLSIAEIVKNK